MTTLIIKDFETTKAIFTHCFREALHSTYMVELNGGDSAHELVRCKFTCKPDEASAAFFILSFMRQELLGDKYDTPSTRSAMNRVCHWLSYSRDNRKPATFVCRDPGSIRELRYHMDGLSVLLRWNRAKVVYNMGDLLILEYKPLILP